MQLLNQAARALEGYLHTLELEAPAEPFDRLKELFAETLNQRAAAADETGSYLANAFAFLDESLPGSQELVIFATELTAGFYTSWYIETFGCEAYFAHNKDLLFADTENALLGEIAAAVPPGTMYPVKHWSCNPNKKRPLPFLFRRKGRAAAFY